MDKLIRAKMEIALSRFNFDNVAKAMAEVDWTYNRDDEPPDQDSLFETAKELLTIAYNDATKEKSKEPIVVISGGFEATFIPETSVFELKFIMEESNSRIDDEK